MFMRGAGFLGNSGYAINVLASATDYDIAECNIPANGGGKIAGHTANTARKVVRRNAGFITEAVGQAALASGASSVQVAHGLDLTPVFVLATIYSASAQAAGSNLPRVSANTATTFTYDIGVAASAALTLMWEAKA